MNFDPDARVSENIINVALRENHGGLIGTPVPTEVIRNRLLHYLADMVASSCVRVKAEKYSTEYRVEVYVLTADQLERLVQTRAQRLYPGMPEVVEVRAKP